MTHPISPRRPLIAARRPLIAAAVVGAFLAVAGCGDSGGDTAPTATEVAQATVPQAGPVTGANADAVCVRNAGDRSGVSQKAATALKKAGITVVSDPKNLSTSAITENTVLYASGQEALAKKAAENLGEQAQLQPRPQSFDPCDGAVVVVLV